MKIIDLKQNQLEMRKLITAYFENLLVQEFHLFPRKGMSNNASKNRHGVYIIYGNDKKTVYHVGRTYRGKEMLFQRIRNHLHGNSSFMKNYSKIEKITLHENFYYQYLYIDDPVQRALTESFAAGKLCPIYVGTGERKNDTFAKEGYYGE